MEDLQDAQNLASMPEEVDYISRGSNAEQQYQKELTEYAAATEVTEHIHSLSELDRLVDDKVQITERTQVLPVSGSAAIDSVHNVIDRVLHPTTLHEQAQQQSVLKVVESVDHLDRIRRVSRARSSSAEGPRTASIHAYGPENKQRAIRIVVTEREDDYEEDEHIYTTEEWLKLCSWVEKTRMEMTCEPGGQHPAEGSYSYRAQYDGANDEMLDLRFARTTFKLRRSIASHNSEEESEWSRAELLYHSDWTRHIISCHSISDEDMEAAALILSKLLEHEVQAERMVKLETIAYARLDKLIDAIINEEEDATLTLFFEKALFNAIELRDRWKDRFGLRYKKIDELRLTHLRTCGAFHDVVVNRYSNDEKTMWIVKRCKPTGTYIEMDNRYRPGEHDWWLNLACAYRDGIVGDQFEILSSCRYGVLTLALLDGNEDLGDHKTSSYTIKGRFSCIPLELIKLNNGKPLRILRGCGLSSIWAPKAGVRYDGLYTLKTFGTKYDGNNIWTWSLTLEQIDREPDVVEVLRIPSPSQYDDWKLCNQMVKAILEGAQKDVAKIEALRDRALPDEWNRELTRISRRLSDVI